MAEEQGSAANPYEAAGSFLFHFGRRAGIEIDIPESFFNSGSPDGDMRG